MSDVLNFNDPNMSYSYTSNQKNFTVGLKEKMAKIFESDQSIELLSLEGNHAVVSNGNQTFEIWVVEEQPDYQILNVDGIEIKIEKRERLADLFEKIGYQEDVKANISEIKAPMPGTIIDILVKEGQEIKENDPILILEAMKMENIIRATAPATVSEIVATSGTVVQKNDTLIKF